MRCCRWLPPVGAMIIAGLVCANPSLWAGTPQTRAGEQTAPGYAWRRSEDSRPLETVFAPPAGYSRNPSGEGFAAWLRGLPVRAGSPPVHLFDGSLKRNQGVHLAVVDMDVGGRDLQQCADAVIRLRAEYLFASGWPERICFHFTSGSSAPLRKWQQGYRAVVDKGRVSWEPRAAPNSSYDSFRAYLDTVFTYAGTRSLERELVVVEDATRPEAGNVYIQGGSPGHAVIVVDVAETASGDRVFLLAQSYMPAQEIHVLRNPQTPESPWYRPRADGGMVTPEWDFPAGSLRRFPPELCGR